MRSKWSESVQEYILKFEQQYWELLQCSVDLTLEMFVLLMQGSPVYVIWIPDSFPVEWVAMQTLKGDTFPDGVLFSEDVSGHQWMRPSPALSWPLPSGGRLTFKQHQPSLRKAPTELALLLQLFYYFYYYYFYWSSKKFH